MKQERFYYIIRLEYLGFRFSGWQKQPGQRTIEGMLLKTLKFILPDSKYKILGAGRTDAKVSALDAAFELFIEDEPLPELAEFLTLFNRNLPPDIRVTSIIPTTKDFNVIKDSKRKEYIYLFSFGAKNHPFCAPFLANIIDDLDIATMSKAARLFEGEHDFSAYTARLQPNTRVMRQVDSCSIVTNTYVEASFLPEHSYALKTIGDGFMRYQIRMMMGALIQLGKGELTTDDIKESLKPGYDKKLTFVAPGSGLLLNGLDFKNSPRRF
ncbi:tRNA pseudouridine synthase A [Maribacter sp. R77961]|uniref:tRNA pseudouridine synthase A n=1 Tax=Maribacter sp. R77961 TaxID=3093871 RepID=UPI0037C81027